MAISIDSKILATGSNEGTIHLWDIEKGNQLSALRGHTGPINSLVFSSDGKTLVSGDNYSAIFSGIFLILKILLNYYRFITSVGCPNFTNAAMSGSSVDKEAKLPSQIARRTPRIRLT